MALENYFFTADWFGGNIGVWQQHLSHLAGKPSLAFLEIGCFEGRATVWLLGNILTHETSKIECLDIFEGNLEHDSMGVSVDGIEQRFDHNIKTAKGTNKVVKIKGYSQETLRKLLLDHYDFIYIDGSHTAADVLEDAVLSFRLLKSGGIMIFDDYEWNWYNDELLLPKIAIDAFLKIYQRKCELLHKGYQVIVRRI